MEVGGTRSRCVSWAGEVYAGLIVVLMSAMMHGPKEPEPECARGPRDANQQDEKADAQENPTHPSKGTPAGRPLSARFGDFGNLLGGIQWWVPDMRQARMLVEPVPGGWWRCDRLPNAEL